MFYIDYETSNYNSMAASCAETCTRVKIASDCKCQSIGLTLFTLRFRSEVCALRPMCFVFTDYVVSLCSRDLSVKFVFSLTLRYSPISLTLPVDLT